MINLNKSQTFLPQISEIQDLNSGQINLGSWAIPEEINSPNELSIKPETVTDILKPKLAIQKTTNIPSRYKKLNKLNDKNGFYGDLKKIHTITDSRGILTTSWRNFGNIKEVDIELNQLNQAMDHINIDIDADKGEYNDN